MSFAFQKKYYTIRTRIDSEIIMKKYKKPLLIALVVADVAVITFFLVVSIMLLTVVIPYHNKADQLAHSQGLIHAILEMPAAGSFFAFVFPIFLVLAGNIVGLMLYVRKTTKKEPAKIEDLTEEQKEELRQELLRDLQNQSKPEEK